MTKIKSLIILGCITALGLALRFYHNLDISLWHDEAFSALLIKYSWGEMFYRIGLDVHPPAYYVALRFWHYLFGDSLASLRGFSVFFGTATIPLAYAFVKTAFNTQPVNPPAIQSLGESVSTLKQNSNVLSIRHLATSAPLLAAALIAINPFLIQYSTEARMYTFGAFVVLAAAWYLVKASSSKLTSYKLTTYYLSFGLLCGVAILTHYYLLFTVAAMCLCALYFEIKNQISNIKTLQTYHFKHFLPLLTAYLLTALCFLPWLKWFFYQYKQVGAGYWIPPMDKWSIPTTLYQMLIGTGVDISKTATQWLVIALTAALALVTADFLRRSRRLFTFHFSLFTFFAWLSPFLGSLLFLILTKLKGSDSSVYLIRYFSFAAPFFSIMIAVWLSSLLLYNHTNVQLKKYIVRTIGCILIISLIIVNLATFSRYWKDLKIIEKPGMAGAVQLLLNNARTNDHLIVGSSFEFFNLKYYLKSHTSSLTPLLYSAGNTETKNLPHFAGTAILTNQDLFPDFEKVMPGQTVWLLWTNGFGGSKPEVPNSWIQVEEKGFAEVRPYVGTWIVVTKYHIPNAVWIN